MAETTEAQIQLLLKLEREGLLEPDLKALLQQLRPGPRSLATVKDQPPPTGGRPLGQLAIEEGVPIGLGITGFALGGPAGGAGGAMIGRGAAPYLAEAAGYEPTPPMTRFGRLGDVAIEGGTSLGGELIARLGVPAVRNVGRRMALGAFDLSPAPDAAARIGTLGQAGVEPTLADVLGPGANAGRREAALAMTPGGGPVVQESRQARARALTEETERSRLRLGPESTAMERGTEASAAIEATVGNMRRAENEAWNQLKVRVGSPTPMATPARKRMAAALLREQRLLEEPDTAFMRQLEGIINGPDAVPFEALLARRSAYLEEADRPLLVRDKHAAAYSRLAGATLEDIEAGVRAIDPRHGALYDRARRLTARKHELIEDMNINKLRDMDPEQVAKLAGNRLTESDLTRLKDVLLGRLGVGPTPGGREAWNKIRRAIMDRVFEGGEGFADPRVLVGGTEGARTLNPERLARNFDRVGGMGVLLEPTERMAFNNIQRAADVMARTARAGQPIGSPTAQVTNYTKGGRLAQAGGTILGAALTQQLGGGPMTTGMMAVAGGVAGDAAMHFRQRAAAQMLTSPQLARQYASPMVTRWIEEFNQTGVMPRMLARLIGQTTAHGIVGSQR